MVDYRFQLRIGTVTATPTLLHPIWKDDLALEWQKEQNQWFHRAGLSGSIELIRDDYDAVMDANLAFDTVFFLDLEKTVDGGTTWTLYWRGRFTRTDCKVNLDDKILTVKPDVYDDYTAILNGMENEYDLIKLTPAIESLMIRKRPCIQLYTQGDDTVDCIYGNQSFEQDAEIPSTYDNVENYLKDRCHFAITESFIELNFVEISAGYENDFSAPFKGTMDYNNSGSTLTNTTDTYYIVYFCRKQVVPDTDYYKQTNGLDIYKRGETGIKWHYEQSRFIEWWNRDEYEPLPEEIPFNNESTDEIDMMAIKTSQSVFSRLVCSVDSLGTTPTFELYGDDIVANNRNYRRAVGYDMSQYVVQSSNMSQDPTKWGRADNGQYFLPPDNSVDWIPIGRSRWVNTSLWFNPTLNVLDVDKQATYPYMLNDAYPLHACISVLLTAIGSDVTFSNTTDYSLFLYQKVNGVYSDPIAQRDCRMYLTPKSNITAGEYQTPAMKGLITLKDIFDMLRDTYRLYWFVDDQKRLRIEHVSFFEKGGSYSVTPTVGIDLTAMTNKRNGKTLDYGTNAYEYERSEMPERYEFGWMDDVTDKFRGEPIQILSSYVEKGQKEEITVSQFDSDVDYMLLQPSAISLDGFALLGVEPADAITPGLYNYIDGQDGAIIPIASYVQGKTVVLKLDAIGDEARLWWWFGDRAEESDNPPHIVRPPIVIADWIFDVPDGATGFSFVSSGLTSMTLYSMRLRTDVQGTTETLAVPMLTEQQNNTWYRMQNGNLGFHKLQNPYWLYDLPASSVALNNDTANPVTALSVRKCRKQTVSIPLGDTEPDLKQLVRTGIGEGIIHQLSLRLTSRMAKTQLRYDTEQ